MAKRTKASKSRTSKKRSKAKRKRPLRAAAKAHSSRARASKAHAAKARAAKPVPVKAGIVPCLSCRDAPAAIEFLCDAFGFARKMVVEGPNGTIAHAELTLGNAMVMLGSIKDTEYGRMVTSPREAGVCTQTIYLIVPDPDAHHDRARVAGAEIVLPLTTQDYGGRDYTCRDLEGHVWTFGTYDPWA